MKVPGVSECQGCHPSEKFCYSTYHLPEFEKFRESTGLLGEAYIPILKCTYLPIVSTKLSKLEISLGRIRTDGRVHTMIPLISGGGKLGIKNGVKEILKGSIRIGEPTSLWSEQLIGKTKVMRGEQGQDSFEQVPGYFALNLLILEEMFGFLSSNESIYVESRKYLRDALDPYGRNEITKKLVDVPYKERLAYCPHFSTIAFIQPLPLSPMRVYEGDTRRFLIPYVDLLRVDRRGALRERVRKGGESWELMVEEFKEFYIKLPSNPKFEFDEGIEEKFTYLSELLVDYGLQYSEKISYYTIYKQFTIQEFLLKISAIIAFINNRTCITEEDIRLGFCDLLEFLNLEFGFIEDHINGSLDYDVNADVVCPLFIGIKCPLINCFTLPHPVPV